MKKKAAGRPKMYVNSTRVRIAPGPDASRLQENSDRRAIIMMLVDNCGSATLGEISKYFAIPMRDKVLALIRADWLEVVE